MSGTLGHECTDCETLLNIERTVEVEDDDFGDVRHYVYCDDCDKSGIHVQAEDGRTEQYGDVF